MRSVVQRALALALILTAALCSGFGGTQARAGGTARVAACWQDAYVFSFRSPDLLTDEADERWGRDDDRLVSGGILSDFPAWLREHADRLAEARREGRPILLSLHVHSGYGTGLVTYSWDIDRAEAASYPWLIRQLIQAGLDTDDVTVAVDTCNAQATAAHQLRPDLVARGVEAWPPFARWRRSQPARQSVPLAAAYPLFSRDRVASHLEGRARRLRARVTAASYQPLTVFERASFRAHLYGPRGVILGTPAFFNLLRLGPRPRNTLTADLLHDRLDPLVVDALLDRNKAEFRRFRDFAFLQTAGPGPVITSTEPTGPTAGPRRRQDRIEHGG